MRGGVPVLIAALGCAALQLVLGKFGFYGNLLSLVGVNVILAVSLNIINGMTGQFSIGHAGFMAVGAYSAGILSVATKDYKIGFGTEQLSVLLQQRPEAISDQLFLMLSLGAGGIAAAVCGLVVGLPSLRLRGDYLAIVTLGFGEIIRVVVQNTASLGGALGLSGVPQRASFGMVWFWVFLVLLLAQRLAASPHGRSLWAIREDEVAAEAMGVDTTGYKVRAFVLSSFFAGVAGGLFAHFVPLLNPSSFDFARSMEVVVMIVAGGLGSTTGAFTAAVFLTLLPEAMRSIFGRLGGGNASLAQTVDQVRKPVYGILLVIIMLTRPQGIFGTHELWDVIARFRKKARA